MLLRSVLVVPGAGVDARAGANRSDRSAAESIPPADADFARGRRHRPGCAAEGSASDEAELGRPKIVTTRFAVRPSKDQRNTRSTPVPRRNSAPGSTGSPLIVALWNVPSVVPRRLLTT